MTVPVDIRMRDRAHQLARGSMRLRDHALACALLATSVPFWMWRKVRYARETGSELEEKDGKKNV